MLERSNRDCTSPIDFYASMSLTAMTGSTFDDINLPPALWSSSPADDVIKCVIANKITMSP